MLRRSAASLSGKLVVKQSQHFYRDSFLNDRRFFHASLAYNGVKPYLLADIGEGITECQIIKWFVKPGDTVQQFDPICEVQSDKASVEITSRYDGIINKIYYETDEMALVGSPLMDIELDDGDDANAENTSNSPQTKEVKGAASIQASEQLDIVTDHQDSTAYPEQAAQSSTRAASTSEPRNNGIMLPAVRRLLNEHKINLSEVTATGKGGRVLKEDVQKHLASKTWSEDARQAQQTSPSEEDTVVPLTPVQNQMYQSMTQSLNIPHFLYTQTVDTTDLTALRKKYINGPWAAARLSPNGGKAKLSPLSFIVKALSQAVTKHPTLNSSLVHEHGAKPRLALKGSHNIGIAMDTPKGLVVPVIHNVQRLSVLSVAAEIERLSSLARNGRLTPDDMKGATMIVSNIGSIGGQAVAPIIVPPMVMIIAVGRSQQVPVFRTEEGGTEKIVKREHTVLSWSADHRVLDGAAVARCAQDLAFWIENANMLGLELR